MMIVETKESSMALSVHDVSRQRRVALSGVDREISVGELVRGVVPRMRLPRLDAQGRPLSYQVRLDREGRHLNFSERVGEVLEDRDELTVQPFISAG
jgi:hypothetical protein